ncbi:patatin-like phospholipase family protein [Aspergillus stella-maris]|uniref:patatin-like phospholipase family protein n=1 Tax=Aspergillus stella-maris TaxID=1810926 RepID=UPI003CCCAE78
MHPKGDASWLEVSLNQGQALVRDHGRLAHLISDLPRPDQQWPIISIFLGGKSKNAALQAIFPRNNIERTRPRSGLGLRCDTTSVNSDEPILFADGTLSQIGGGRPLGILSGDRLIPCGSMKPTLRALYSRLIFPFANLVCIFAADFPGLTPIARFLVGCAVGESTSGLPSPVRPKVIVVMETTELADPQTNEQEIAQFYRILNESDPLRSCNPYSSVNLIQLDPKLPQPIQNDRLCSAIRDQQNAMQEVRRNHFFCFNARHLQGLYTCALDSLTLGVESNFNFVRATRQNLPVSAALSRNVTHFLDAGKRVDCAPENLIKAVASALIMDHYVPGMMNSDKVTSAVALVKQEFVMGFHHSRGRGLTAVEFRKESLRGLSYDLDRIQSHTICLYCLIHSAQHCQKCHHAICDNCAQIFGEPATDAEYQFTVSICIICLSRENLVINVLPPTMDPSVLAIDGGGVRGVIPLEFLILIQESLGSDCMLHELVDLTVGTSSGGLITLGLSGMEWDATMCSRTFDRLARRIFYERRESMPSRFFRSIFGPQSLFGGAFQLASWFFHDSCYDSKVFEDSLREAFGDDIPIFGPVPDGSRSHSNSKFAVIATNIAKETKSFVFGNFNVSDWFAGHQHEYDVFRGERGQEPLFWEVARATAAAPFFFATADLGQRGSFQDGGLKDNFAADIARRICRRIWPSRPRVSRLISFGTGNVNAQTHSPQFRHVFRDGFLQRSFGAFLSQMDTASKWLKMRSELEEEVRPNFMRLDVSLENVPCTIDNADGMDEYRNLVIRQPGSNRMARDVAVALLVSRFYMTLQRIPEKIPGGEYVICHGMIRCKGRVRSVVDALERLRGERMDFANGTEHLTCFGGVKDICVACGRYCKPVFLLLKHCDEPVHLSLRINREKSWKLNGFPSTMTSLVAAQHLDSPFGVPSHDSASAKPCSHCDGLKAQGTRRRRESDSVGRVRKRLCRLG